MRKVHFSLKNISNVVRGILLSGAFSLSCFFPCYWLSAEEPVNLLENPGAEKSLAAAQTPFNLWYMLTNDFVELADTVPEGWGVCGCGYSKISWGTTDKEAHSGEKSCFLKVLDRLKEKDTDRLRVRIILGKSSGQTGEQAMKVESGKEYFYSFWMKGDVESINVEIFTWITDEGKTLTARPTSHMNETVGADWKQISGIFKPGNDAKTMAVAIGVLKAKAGQTIYVDDAVVGLNTPATRELAEALGKDAKDKRRGPRAPDKPAPTLRVLFIGNSHMDECQLPWMVRFMSQSAPADCPRIKIGYILQGGWGLKNHWEAGDGPKTARGRIAAGHWDYVVIQARTDVALPELETYVPLYDEAIRKAGAKTILFVPSSQLAAYPAAVRKANDMQLEFGKKSGILVAPAGHVWIRYLGPKPSETQLLELYAPDKIHPGGKGTYLYACLLYSVITGKSPVGLVHDFAQIPADYVYGKRISIEPKEAVRMQQAAWAQYLEGRNL